MKAKVTLTDNYSGRHINIICEVDNVASTGQEDQYAYNPSNLSKRQRRRIEDYFGKVAAYYTTATINK